MDSRFERTAALLDFPDLPLGAFENAAGRMRLFGKSDAPAAPDYIGQANATAAGNLDLARAGASANRIDQTTPYGSIQYTQGDGFDQSGYDAAMANYNATMDKWRSGSDPALEQYKAAGGTAPAAPKKNDFITNPDHWTSTIQLSPEQQQLLDANTKTQLGLAGLQGSALDRVKQTLGTGLDISDIPGLIYGIGDGSTGDTWSKYSGLLMDRLNPDLDQQQAALDTKLANMGMTAGSEGWGIQQGQFGKQRNDADIAAQLAGANLAMQGAQLNNSTRQQAINERVDLRQLPLNELNALRSGASLTNPTFSQPGQQQLTAGADLSGAANSQYNAAVNQTNAQNQQAASNTGAGVGLLATAASFY